MLLNHMAKISQRGARLDECQGLVEAFLGDANQPLGVWCDLADTHHDAGIAMPAIFDHGDININDVTVAELFIVRGYAVADHLVDGGADRLWESLVI